MTATMIDGKHFSTLTAMVLVHINLQSHYNFYIIMAHTRIDATRDTQTHTLRERIEYGE